METILNLKASTLRMIHSRVIVGRVPKMLFLDCENE